MCEPRGPIGTGKSDDRPDAGLLSRTKHTTPGPKGQRPAKAPSKRKTAWGSEVLAGFDFSNAVIWVNEESLAKMDRARRNGEVLNKLDVATLAHEFFHVWQNRDILVQFPDIAPAGAALDQQTKQQLSKTRSEKAAAMVRRDTERIAKMTEEQYIEFRLKREGDAETKALTVVAELENSKILLSFARSDADTWLHNNRWSYVEGNKKKKGIRKHYRETKEKLAKAEKAPGGQAAQAVTKVTTEVMERPKTRQVMRLASSYVPILPNKEQSPTFHKLLRVVDRFDTLIVVSMALPK